MDNSMAEIPAALLSDTRLGAARILLVAMYSLTPHGCDRPTVWARHSTLAGMIGADDRTVRRHLVTLRDAGVIRRVGDSWELGTHSDGTPAEWAGPASNPDNSVRTPDNIDRASGQNCPEPRTILSAPTLEEHKTTMNTEGVEKSPPAQVEFALEAPEPKVDEVAELWEYQDELRAWAFRQRGRTGRRGARPLRLDKSARRAVSAVLRDYSVDEAREALRTAARDAASSDRSLSYFDGVSNWRRDNFRRFAAADSSLLLERSRTTVRSEGLGPLLPECGGGEQCQRSDERLDTIAQAMLDEVVG